MLRSSITSYSPLQFGAKNIMYQEYSPAIPLFPYIDCYWIVTGEKLGANQKSTLKVLPDGCVDMIFRKHHSSEYVGTITGVMNEYMDVLISQDMLFLGVRFRPGGVRAIFRTKVDSFSGQRVHFTDLNKTWTELQDRLNANELQWMDLLNQYFLTVINKNMNAQFSNQMKNMFHQIYRHHGNIKIQQLARSGGLSTRHLQRLFYEWTGLSPKTFCRVVRFHFTLKQLSRGEFDIDSYSDQAHFIREFRTLTGVTPSKWMSDFFNTKTMNGIKLYENKTTMKGR